jgi:hypothetical protein
VTNYCASPSDVWGFQVRPWTVVCNTPDGVSAPMLFTHTQEAAEKIAEVLNDDEA